MDAMPLPPAVTAISASRFDEAFRLFDNHLFAAMSLPPAALLGGVNGSPGDGNRKDRRKQRKAHRQARRQAMRRGRR